MAYSQSFEPRFPVKTDLFEQVLYFCRYATKKLSCIKWAVYRNVLLDNVFVDPTNAGKCEHIKTHLITLVTLTTGLSKTGL